MLNYRYKAPKSWINNPVYEARLKALLSSIDNTPLVIYINSIKPSLDWCHCDYCNGSIDTTDNVRTPVYCWGYMSFCSETCRDLSRSEYLSRRETYIQLLKEIYP